ncbi:hypothetical protein RDABS01_028710 [Bienertia sinuspersici]
MYLNVYNSEFFTNYFDYILIIFSCKFWLLAIYFRVLVVHQQTDLSFNFMLLALRPRFSVEFCCNGYPQLIGGWRSSSQSLLKIFGNSKVANLFQGYERENSQMLKLTQK